MVERALKGRILPTLPLPIDPKVRTKGVDLQLFDPGISLFLQAPAAKYASSANNAGVVRAGVHLFAITPVVRTLQSPVRDYFDAFFLAVFLNHLFCSYWV